MRNATSAEDRRDLEAVPDRDGDRHQGRIAWRAPAYACTTGFEPTLSATTTPPGSSFVRANFEERLVVVLPGVEEDDVEAVLERRQASPSRHLRRAPPTRRGRRRRCSGRHAAILRSSCSSETTRPPRIRAAAASQIVEYPREPPISSTSQPAFGATSAKSSRPASGPTGSDRSEGGTPAAVPRPRPPPRGVRAPAARDRRAPSPVLAFPVVHVLSCVEREMRSPCASRVPTLPESRYSTISGTAASRASAPERARPCGSRPDGLRRGRAGSRRRLPRGARALRRASGASAAPRTTTSHSSFAWWTWYGKRRSPGASS